MAVLFALLFAAALIRLALLRRELGRLTAMLQEIDAAQSNQRVTVSSRDKKIAALAGAVNALYEEVYRERGRHSRAMDELRQSMANISHDLRTPLTSIIGYVKLLEDENLTDEQRGKYLSVVSGKASSLHRMIEGLFLLARLEAGAHYFTMERMEDGGILAEELAGFYEPLTAAGSQPRLSLSEEPLWITADASGLARVFGNLLQNMVKHGGGEIGIRSEQSGGNAVFTFSNRARGMTQADAGRLFCRFYTAGRMRSGENTGLGLAIVKEFVERMGGRVCCRVEGDLLVIALEWRLAA